MAKMLRGPWLFWTSIPRAWSDCRCYTGNRLWTILLLTMTARPRYGLLWAYDSSWRYVKYPGKFVLSLGPRKVDVLFTQEMSEE